MTQILLIGVAIILSHLTIFFLFNPTANRRVRKLFRKKTSGAFVEVFLDYGFGRITDATTGEPSFRPCLHIIDLSSEKAMKALSGYRFDWHKIDSHWRHYLEMEGFHAVEWLQMQEYLKRE